MDDLKEILAAATPGPWFVDRSYEIGPRSTEDDQTYGMILGCADAFGENKAANARLIAMAPDLAAEVLRLRAEVERLTERETDKETEEREEPKEGY